MEGARTILIISNYYPDLKHFKEVLRNVGSREQVTKLKIVRYRKEGCQ
jgi:hypothetical protein